MGGNIGQEVVFRHPERIRSLVMLGCTCNTQQLRFTDSLLLRIAIPLLRVYPYEMLKRQSARVCSVKPEVKEYLYRAFGQHTKSEMVAILAEVLQCLHYEPGYCIRQPILIAHGVADSTGNIRRIAPAWAKREPHCRYEIIPDAGHAANLDNPSFFNRILLAFLRGQPQQAR